MRSLSRILGLATLCLAAIVSSALAQNTSLPEVDSSDAGVLRKIAELAASVDSHESRLDALEALQRAPKAATDQTAKHRCVCGDGCQCDAGGTACPCPSLAKPVSAQPRFRYTAQMTWPGWNGPDRFNALRRHLQTEWHSQAAGVWQMSDTEVVMLHDRLHGKDNSRTLVYLTGSEAAAQPVARAFDPVSDCPGGNCNRGSQMLGTCSGPNCNGGKRGRFGIIW